MAVLPESLRRAQLTGNRIRERRLAVGMKQSALAEAAGISASYLNLIEHNRRKIGGKLLIAIARGLGVEPSALTEGADATLYDTLQSAARDMGEAFGAAPETDRIDELATRFPGWTGLIAAQHKHIATQDAATEGLRDRLAHDPVLAEAMHEILSSVAAVRSTADILARERDLDPVWLARFHRNLHEEAERLATRATAIQTHFDAPQTGAAPQVSTPIETVEAMFDAARHHFPAIEADGRFGIPTVLAQAAGMEDAATRALAEERLKRYARDAARLPMATLLPALAETGFDPGKLIALGHGDVALVLRRLASLPPEAPAPDCGLAVCDAAGALLFRRRLASFSIPRFGPGCPLLPLYGVLGRPGQPDTAVLEMPSGARFRCWSVAQPVAQPGFGVAPVLQATMLIAPLGAEDAAPGAGPVLGGPGCISCSREGCPARR